MNPHNEPIALAINRRIIGKPPAEQRGWHADQWERVTMRPAQVAKMAIREGYAWTCDIAPDGGGRRKRETFAGAQLLGIDFDHASIERVLDDYPLAAAHASFAYESASATPDAPRCRLVFCADEPLDYEPARALIRALYWHFHEAEPDIQTTDPTRLWYGAPGKKALARYGILDAETRAGILEAYTAANPPKAAPRSSHRRPSSRYGQSALTRELARMEQAGEGNRNARLYGAACNLFELVNAGALEASAIEELGAVAVARGLTESEAQQTITSAKARTAGKCRTAPIRAECMVTW